MARLIVLVLLLVPGVALADPITLVAGLAPIFGSAVAGFLVSYGGYIAFGALQLAGAASARRKQRAAAAKQRAAYLASLQDRNVTVLSTEAPWQIVYGSPAPIGGAIQAILTSGDNDEFQHLVIIYNARSSEAIDEVYIDGVAVGSLDASGWCQTGSAFYESGADQTTTELVTFNGSGIGTVSRTVSSLLGVTMTVGGGSGDTSSAPAIEYPATAVGTTITAPTAAGLSVYVSYLFSTGVARVNIQKHLSPGGVDSADAFLIASVPDKWTINHKASGFTYLVVTLDLRFGGFQGGPPNITAKGRWSILYDYRTATSAYSANPALAAADFLTADYGFAATSSQIDTAAVIAAANDCDSQDFECDGLVSTASSRDSNLQQLEDCMAGASHFSGGVWRIMAGAWATPVMSLTDADLAGPIEVVQAAHPSAERYNGVRGQYAPASGLGAVPDYTPYSVSAYVTADRKAKVLDLPLPMVGTNAQCQKLAAIAVERSRLGETINYPAKLNAWKLQPGDRVYVTNAELGYSSKTFRMVDWSFQPTAPVGLVLTEDTSSVYTGTFTDPDATDPTSNLPNPFAKPVAPTALAAESGDSVLTRAADGTIATRVLVSWSAPTARTVVQGGYTQLQWRLATTADDLWQSLDLPATTISQYLTDVRDGTVLIIRVRHLNAFGKDGTWATITHAVLGKSAPPDPFASFLVLVQPDGTRQFNFGYAAEDDKPSDWLGAEIRYVAGTDPAPDWDTMTPLVDAATYFTSSPVELNAPAAGEWTFACKSVDTSRNKSTYLLQSITLNPRRLGTVFAEYDEFAEGWLGTLSGFHIQDTYLQANTAETWTTAPATWTLYTSWAMSPTSPASYVSAVRDFGTVIVGGVSSTIDADGTVVEELATSADGVTWSGWSSASAQFNSRYLKLRITVTATGPHPYPLVRAWSYQITAPLRTEYINDLVISGLTGSYRIGTGDIRIPLVGAFTTLKNTQVTIQDSSAGTWVATRIDQTLTYGPRWQFRLNGVLTDPAFVDFYVEGY